MIQPQPPGYKTHTYSFSIEIPASEDMVWLWLNDPKTFTDTQYWPYKVEFYSPDPNTIPNGFHEGVLTNHSGPFINFAGKLVSIKPNYRDLQYFYGSYAISFNWIRPFRLEFASEQMNDATKLTCTISSYVKPSLYKFWDWSQKLFWSRFRKWSTKSIVKLQRKALTDPGIRAYS